MLLEVTSGGGIFCWVIVVLPGLLLPRPGENLPLGALEGQKSESPGVAFCADSHIILCLAWIHCSASASGFMESFRFQLLFVVVLKTISTYLWDSNPPKTPVGV